MPPPNIDLSLVKTGGVTDNVIKEQLDVSPKLQTLTMDEIEHLKYIWNSCGKYSEE